MMRLINASSLRAMRALRHAGNCALVPTNNTTGRLSRSPGSNKNPGCPSVQYSRTPETMLKCENWKKFKICL